MFAELEKLQIRGIIYSPQWKSIERVAEMVINKFRGENTLKETEWETLRETIFKEGKASGVELFFQELIKISNEQTGDDNTIN